MMDDREKYFLELLAGKNQNAGFGWIIVATVLIPAVYLFVKFPGVEGLIGASLFLSPLFVIVLDDLVDYLHRNTRVGPWYENSSSGRFLHNVLDVFSYAPLVLFLGILWFTVKLTERESEEA